MKSPLNSFSDSDGDDQVIIESPLTKVASDNNAKTKAKSKHKIVLKNESISGTIDTGSSPFTNKKKIEANNKDLESVSFLTKQKKTKKINMED